MGQTDGCREHLHAELLQGFGQQHREQGLAGWSSGLAQPGDSSVLSLGASVAWGPGSLVVVLLLLLLLLLLSACTSQTGTFSPFGSVSCL